MATSSISKSIIINNKKDGLSLANALKKDKKAKNNVDIKYSRINKRDIKDFFK